jgi:sulfur carrier protein ThiS
MQIKIEFVGFPVIYDLFPEGPHPYTFQGENLGQLVEDLITWNDQRIKDSILDPGTKSLDPTIQVMINQQLIPQGQIQEQKIKDADHLIFLKLLAGG